MAIQKLEGHIRHWNSKGGWGTISYVIDGILYEAWTSFIYFIEVLQKGDVIPLGTKVLFTIHPCKTGRLPVAKNVDLLGPIERPAVVLNQGGAR